MNNISISQLKASPADAIRKAADYPLPVASRNKIKAYLVGKELYEQMVAYMEDYVDIKAVKEADVTKGRDFEEVAKELGI